MLQGWVVILVAFGYIGLLFVIARYGDRVRGGASAPARTIISEATEPRAPHPTTTTRAVRSRACPSRPMPANSSCRE